MALSNGYSASLDVACMYMRLLPAHSGCSVVQFPPSQYRVAAPNPALLTGLPVQQVGICQRNSPTYQPHRSTRAQFIPSARRAPSFDSDVEWAETLPLLWQPRRQTDGLLTAHTLSCIIRSKPRLQGVNLKLEAHGPGTPHLRPTISHGHQQLAD